MADRSFLRIVDAIAVKNDNDSIFKPRDVGSNPTTFTIFGSIAQW